MATPLLRQIVIRVGAATVVAVIAAWVTPVSVLAQIVLPAPPASKSVDEQEGGTRVVANRATPTDPDAAGPVTKGPAEGPSADEQASLTLPAEHHAWARFKPGAWRRIKITTESFDVNGRFIGRSVTSQTETLKAVDGLTCELEIVSIVEIGGKRLRGAAQTATYNLLCNEPCDRVVAERLDTANISLDGAVIPVERWSLRHGPADSEQSETIYYSPDRSPYVLRRELKSGGEGFQSTTSVTRVDAPLLLDGGIVPSSHVTVAAQEGDNQITRFQVHCDAIPGGLVTASSTERDASGRRVRWSTIELEEYGESQEPVKPRRLWPPFGRFRYREP